MRTSEPGSDHQLAWARSFIASARSAEHRAVLRALLDGAEEVPGLVVDIDLRWSLVKALASLGELDDAAIDAELERDATSAGQRHAATAHAARPTPEAKDAAWRAIMDDPDLPNAILSATIGGFQQAHQDELIAPYTTQYFERIGDIWQTRSSEMAQDIVVGMYPSILVGQQLLDQTDDYLRTANPPAAAAPPARGGSGRRRPRDAGARAGPSGRSDGVALRASSTSQSTTRRRAARVGSR
jgi:aminopeptidase N